MKKLFGLRGLCAVLALCACLLAADRLPRLSGAPSVDDRPPSGQAQAAVLRERRLHKASLGIAAEAPAGWGFTTQTGYPAIIFLLLHPDGSKLSVSLVKTAATSADAFASENKAALRASRFSIVRESATSQKGHLVEVRPSTGAVVIKQLYTVHRARTPSQPSSREGRHDTDGGLPGAPVLSDAGTAPPPSRSAGPADAAMNDGLVVTLTTPEGLAAAHDADLFSLAASIAFDEED